MSKAIIKEYVAFHSVFVCECYAFLAIVLFTLSEKVSIKHGTQWLWGQRWWKIKAETGRWKILFSQRCLDVFCISIHWPIFHRLVSTILVPNFSHFPINRSSNLIMIHLARVTSFKVFFFSLFRQKLKRKLVFPFRCQSESNTYLPMWIMKSDGNLFSFVELLKINCCLSCSVNRKKSEKKNGRHERKCWCQWTRLASVSPEN